MPYACVSEPTIAHGYSSNIVSTTLTRNAAEPAAVPESPFMREPQWMELYHADRSYRAFVEDLFSLFEDEDEEVPPSHRVVDWILDATVLSKLLLAEVWRKPRITTDNEAGVRLSWRDGQRELRAVVPADFTKDRYLYWQDGEKFGGIPQFESATLFQMLVWLNERTRR